MTRQADTLDLTPRTGMPSACASGGCGGAEPLLPPPPSFGDVRVNGVEIDPESIAQEIQHHPAPDMETAWAEAARALAVRELLLQEARRLDLTAEPEEDEAGRIEPEDDALIRCVLETEVSPELPDDDECQRYYAANQQRLRTPDLFDAAHILIEPESAEADAWTVAERRAGEIAQTVGDDPAAFAVAARTHSSCPSRQQDGSLGQVRRGELVGEIHEALEHMADGTTMIRPVRTRFGWHVLRLQRRIPGRTLPYEVVRPKIAEMLEARSWTMASARYIAALAERGRVEGIRIGGE
ncbi:peptidylprolyl isomerase [Sphingomonas sp.]|jgi:peptidyl-prolyl cis-trans isomerase C|uniref:peptidylprolyl isomerase n=1 Tax=Sphingomonas sp. TaxID=28214 RepID=UPI002624B52E|nr:peptidylprolyl isomerase [Sphingomonas sp.]MDF2495432.1 peptidylprolyl isomerase [Sphingomonas sp.]